MQRPLENESKHGATFGRQLCKDGGQYLALYNSTLFCLTLTSGVCLVALDVSSELGHCVRCHVSRDGLALLVVFVSWCHCSPGAA